MAGFPYSSNVTWRLERDAQRDSSACGPASVLNEQLAGDIPGSRRGEIERQTENLRRLPGSLHGNAPHDLGHESLLFFRGCLLASKISEARAKVPARRDHIGTDPVRRIFGGKLPRQTNHAGLRRRI